jgi:uncharacterized protein YsxB (DUF464 family)
MDPVYDAASSDADAICACFGAVAVMTMQANALARAGALLASKDGFAKETGQQMAAKAAAALKTAREQMDALMQDLGDFHNNGDSCSKSMIAVTSPAFDMLRKRKEGISLDD